MRIDDRVQSAVFFQDYSSQPEIDGVKTVPLKKHRAMEGWFMELIRITDGVIEGPDPKFEARQISLSNAVPGRINAFHLHPRRHQDELWCVISGLLSVWLVDVRQDSPTQGNRRQVILSGEEPTILLIPSGVAHGYKAGPDGALLLYVMNDQFTVRDTNEGRLPWDFFGADLWTDNRG
ncbi:MAG: dTDP-4-dehydrorhamnose 3,5-epimerase family protein [Armatimonadetes bacterium]|nr:dTDP-4-dehydrorhamnose 3,5-epimerase family protein [Armatimonadota bacterium]